MLEFETIEHITFKGIKPETEFSPPEKAVSGSLKYLLGEVRDGRMTREEASKAKAGLRKKYESCQRYKAMMDRLTKGIYKACWDFKNDGKYIASLVETFGKIYDGAEDSLLREMAFIACEYFDTSLAEPEQYKQYRLDMDRLKYLFTAQSKGQITLDEQNELSEQRKKVMSGFLDYAFYRIGRGLTGISREDMESLLDIEPLWERLYALAERGEKDKLEGILDAVRIVYIRMKNTM